MAVGPSRSAPRTGMTALRHTTTSWRCWRHRRIRSYRRQSRWSVRPTTGTWPIWRSDMATGDSWPTAWTCTRFATAATTSCVPVRPRRRSRSCAPPKSWPLRDEDRKDPHMSSTSAIQLIDVDRQPGKPPMMRVDQPADAPAWATEHRDGLRGIVAEHGAILVRGLGLRDATEIAAVFRNLSNSLMTEREAFAPRQIYSDGVYSSATWPANQPMCMHHELSYALEVPSLMLFACITPSSSGGATGVADSPSVLRELPADLTERLRREGWQLTRNYNDDIGASIADAFGSDDPSAVEAYCHANAIECEWRPDGGLRTEQRRAAVVRHPI